MTVTVDVLVEEIFLEAGVRGGKEQSRFLQKHDQDRWHVKSEACLKAVEKMYERFKRDHRAENGRSTYWSCLGCYKLINTPHFILYTRARGPQQLNYGVHESCLDRAFGRAKRKGVNVPRGPVRNERVVIRGALPKEAEYHFNTPDPDVFVLRDKHKNIIGLEAFTYAGDGQDFIHKLYEKVLKQYHFQGTAYISKNGRAKLIQKLS